MKFPTDKKVLIAINALFIPFWWWFTGLIIEIIWETIDALGVLYQDPFPIQVIEILFLFLPILYFTYWLWWGKKLHDKKIK